MASKSKTTSTALSSADRAGLKRALDRLEQSSRAAMFESLVVGAFGGKGKKFTKKVASATLGELLGTDLATIEKSHGVTRKDASLIVSIIESLLEGEPGIEHGQPIAAASGLLPPRSPKLQSSIGINSVEAELRLTAGLAKLRTSVALKTLAHHRLGDYWDPSWTRAPFEEALTFEQLSQLKPRALLDKRSFTPQKLSHLIEAMERGVTSATPSVAQITQHPQQATLFTTTHAISTERWKAESAGYTTTLLGSLIVYADEAAKTPEQFVELCRILRAIPERLNAREYLAAMMQEELDDTTVSSLLKIDPNTVRQSQATASQKLESLLKELAPVLHQSFMATLSQPATQIASLTQLLRPDAPSSQFITILCMLFARAVGAAPVMIGGRAQPTVWSHNSSAAERAVRLLVAGLPKSDSELRADATALLGNLPFDTVRDWLKPLTHFNERTLSWNKRE